MVELRIDAAIRTALADAVAWCSSQAVSAEIENIEAKRLREVWDEANRLNVESYQKTGKPSEKAGKVHREIGDYRALIVLGRQLRTAALKPAIEIGEIVQDSDRETAVVKLIARRRALLDSASHAGSSQRWSEKHGRVLVYWPNENLACGGAEYSSNGFFDVNNVPPWDTWFHYSAGTLFAWVPAVLVPLAQNGIDANPENCIDWADESALKNLGL